MLLSAETHLTPFLYTFFLFFSFYVFLDKLTGELVWEGSCVCGAEEGGDSLRGKRHGNEVSAGY